MTFATPTARLNLAVSNYCIAIYRQEGYRNLTKLTAVEIVRFLSYLRYFTQLKYFSALK